MNEIITKPLAAPSSALIERFIAIVGARNAITDPQAQAPYLLEMRRHVRRPHPGGAAAGLGRRGRRRSSSSPTRPRPRSCRRAATPDWSAARSPHHGEIVLSLNRLDKIREVDPTSNTITCEAGVTLQRAREAAAEVDRLYPQLLPSEGTCTIGGNLSTNAGGTAALAHGIARSHALGLEVVLADGRVLQQSQQAQEGQHRLRPARTCSSAPKARSASSPPRCCGWCRARARSRPRSSACRRRRPRSNSSASPPSAPPAA